MEANAEELFNKKVSELKVSVNSFSITPEAYDKIVTEVLEAKDRQTKTSVDYRRLKRYDVLKVGQTNKLILPLCKSGNNSIKYYVRNSEVFDIINKAHAETGHGGIHKLERNLKHRYVNITRQMIKLFLENCQTCLKKRVHPRKVDAKPLMFTEVNVRAQVDLIDFHQMCTDGDYKFILNYQEQSSKFVILRALKTETAAEVAHHLLDIFCTFGVPSVLQSDNGREFVNRVIEELKTLWPQLEIVYGKPRHCQSQGSVKRANRDIEDMLLAWMKDNKSKKWSEGLCFCQFHKNNSFHSGIQKSPYEAMFGRRAQLGPSSNSPPETLSKSLSTELDLEEVTACFKVLKDSEDLTSYFTVKDEKVEDDNIVDEDENLAVEYDNLIEAQLKQANEEEIPNTGEYVKPPTNLQNLEEIESIKMISQIRKGISKNQDLVVVELQEQAKRMKMNSEKDNPQQRKKQQ